MTKRHHVSLGSRFHVWVLEITEYGSISVTRLPKSTIMSAQTESYAKDTKLETSLIRLIGIPPERASVNHDSWIMNEVERVKTCMHRLQECRELQRQGNDDGVGWDCVWESDRLGTVKVKGQISVCEVCKRGLHAIPEDQLAHSSSSSLLTTSPGLPWLPGTAKAKAKKAFLLVLNFILFPLRFCPLSIS